MDPQNDVSKTTRSDKYLDKLEDSYNKKDESVNPIVKLFQKTRSYFLNVWRKSDGYITSKEHNRTLMIQENLQWSGKLAGSYDKQQVGIFCKHLKKKDTPEAKKLRENLKAMTTLQEINTTALFPFGDRSPSNVKNAYLDKLVRQVSDLEPGQSMWVDMTSTPGHHSLKGRIERTDAGYIFQMSNTGAGIDEHADWHKPIYYQSCNYYQTVIEWGPFATSANFSKVFFSDILNACLEAKVPEGVNVEKIKGEGSNGEDLAAIDAIYKTMGHHLGNPADLEMNKDNKSHWSTSQEGPSCVPNSIWALIRVSVSEDEYQELRTQLQLDNLKDLYHSIVSGNDRTDYALLLALEQVTTLILDAEKEGKAAPQLLKNIREDIVDRSNLANLRVKIKNFHPIPITPITEEIELVAGRLKRLTGSLRADVSLEPMLIDQIPVKLKIERDIQGEPSGFSTLAYLLYEAVLKDDPNEIETRLQTFTTYMNAIDDPSEITASKQELQALTKMFYILGMDLREVDGTFQSRPKQLALNNISEALYTALYAKCCKEEPNPFSNESAINLAIVGIYENVRMLRKLALTFNKVASKSGRARPEDLQSNIWYKEDRNIRVFHNKTKWHAYSERLYTDSILEQKIEDKITQGIAFNRINFSTITKKPTPLIGLPPIVGGKNYIQSLFFSRTPDKSSVIGSFSPIRDIELPEIDIEFVNEQPVTTSLAGNAYLLYRLLPEASLDAAKLQQINVILDKMNNLPVEDTEIKSLNAVADILIQYSGAFRNLDVSPESIALQQIAAKLGVSLLKKTQTPIPDEYLAEIDYYDILAPKQYLRNNNALVHLLDHPTLD